MPETKKEIEKIVDNEMEKQNVSLTDDQKKAIVSLVDADVTASGGINKEALLNAGKYIAVAAASAAGGAFAVYAVKKWGTKGSETQNHQSSTERPNIAGGGTGNQTPGVTPTGP